MAYPQGMPQGLPQGRSKAAKVTGPQGGVQQLNGFAPQGQGFAPQQLPMGQPQGAQMVNRVSSLARRVRLVRKLLKPVRRTTASVHSALPNS